MAGSRILIVDDQREIARVLQSSLEGLEHELEISLAMSGEEAILELTRGDIDLLVADVRLPGISGLELMEKFKSRNQELKVILISGVTDKKIRREVAKAGADAFFFKPIEIADFLDAVERALGFVGTILPSEMEIEKEQIDEEEEAVGMSEQINQLHKGLKAHSVFLLGDTGQVLVRAGALPTPDVEASLIKQLTSTFTSGVKISHFLSQPIPDTLLSFHGKEYDIYITHVGEAYCLLITMPPQKPEAIGKIAKATQITSKSVLKSLANMGILVGAREVEAVAAAPTSADAPAEAAAPTEPEIDYDSLSDPEMEDLFANLGDAAPKTDDAESFWDDAGDIEVQPSAPSGDGLSFEEAMKLGLTPEDE